MLPTATVRRRRRQRWAPAPAAAACLVMAAAGTATAAAAADDSKLLLHTANHHAQASVQPSKSFEWRRILAHPSHRHGLCGFAAHRDGSGDGGSAVLPADASCTIDDCTVYPSLYTAEMACANLGPRRCGGLAEFVCARNGEYASGCAEILRLPAGASSPALRLCVALWGEVLGIGLRVPSC
jgi:hypothetical protein